MNRIIIKRETYKDLLYKSQLVPELENEIKRLASLITAETKDCKMGSWCKECQHLGHDKSVVGAHDYWNIFAIALPESGEVYYCKKHLHEICPEFERELS